MSPDESRPLTTTVSLSHKVNLGNFEHAELFLSVGGVKADTTAEEIDAALDAGRIAYDRLRVRLLANINETVKRGFLGVPAR